MNIKRANLIYTYTDFFRNAPKAQRATKAKALSKAVPDATTTLHETHPFSPPQTVIHSHLRDPPEMTKVAYVCVCVQFFVLPQKKNAFEPAPDGQRSPDKPSRYAIHTHTHTNTTELAAAE